MGHSLDYPIPSLLRFHSRFSYVDIPVEVAELDLLASPVDGSPNCFIDLHVVTPILAAALFRYLLRSTRGHGHVKVAEHVPAIGADHEICFEIGWEGYIDVAIQRAERHWLPRIHAIKRDQHLAIKCMRDNRTRDSGQRD